MNESLIPLSVLENAIKERRASALRKRDMSATIAATARLLAIVAVLTIVFLMVFGFRIVDGNGMYPSLNDGDLILTYFKASVRKNEIVFYEVNGMEYCGRIVAKEGDTIDFSADGKLYVNGTAQTSDIVFSTYPPKDWTGSITIPDGAVYVLGDYRTQALDSREFGCIPVSDIKCKVIALLRHKQL